MPSDLDEVSLTAVGKVNDEMLKWNHELENRPTHNISDKAQPVITVETTEVYENAFAQQPVVAQYPRGRSSFDKLGACCLNIEGIGSCSQKTRLNCLDHSGTWVEGQPCCTLSSVTVNIHIFGGWQSSPNSVCDALVFDFSFSHTWTLGGELQSLCGQFLSTEYDPSFDIQCFPEPCFAPFFGCPGGFTCIPVVINGDDWHVCYNPSEHSYAIFSMFIPCSVQADPPAEIEYSVYFRALCRSFVCLNATSSLCSDRSTNAACAVSDVFPASDGFYYYLNERTSDGGAGSGFYSTEISITVS